MSSAHLSLATVFDGWDGHHTSLVNAVAPLTASQLAFRPTPGLRSLGEIIRHLAIGRVYWFERMGAPGSAAVAAHVPQWETDRDGNRHPLEDQLPITEDASQLVHWLNLTWAMIDETLTTWTTADLAVTYRHTWNGDTYANSRQWTLYRIFTHDIHHGGQISWLLGMQGIEHFELGDLFGQITLPPLADQSE